MLLLVDNHVAQERVSFQFSNRKFVINVQTPNFNIALHNLIFVIYVKIKMLLQMQKDSFFKIMFV